MPPSAPLRLVPQLAAPTAAGEEKSKKQAMREDASRAGPWACLALASLPSGDARPNLASRKREEGKK